MECWLTDLQKTKGINQRKKRTDKRKDCFSTQYLALEGLEERGFEGIIEVGLFVEVLYLCASGMKRVP
jgi:hypothetical protein